MRRLFAVVAVASAVLWAAVVASWVAGYGARDQWALERVSTPTPAAVVIATWSIYSAQGTLAAGWERTDVGVFPGTRQPPTVRLGPMPADGTHWVHRRRVSPPAAVAAGYAEQPRWWDTHFQWDAPDQPYLTFAGSERHALVYVPQWAAAAALAVLPIAWVAARLRSHGRIPGRCRRCGYDLCASPDRCPECGTNTA